MLSRCRRRLVIMPRWPRRISLQSELCWRWRPEAEAALETTDTADSSPIAIPTRLSQIRMRPSDPAVTTYFPS